MSQLKIISGKDIDNVYKDNSNYGGFHSKNILPNKIQKKFYIINMDDFGSGKGGTHWVMVYNIKPYHCVYFDSFGVIPPYDVIKFMKKSKKKCVYNDIQVQHLNSTACGWFCFYVIDMLNKGNDYTNILLEFLNFDTVNNEHILSDEYDGINGGLLDGDLKGEGIRSFFRKLGRKIKGVATEGIKRVKGFVGGPRKEAPPQVRKWLSEKGDNKIIDVFICRQPIQSYVNTLLNLLSLGLFKQILKKLDHDKLFHLYSYLRLDDGNTYILEKQHVVKVDKVKSVGSPCINVKMHGNIKLHDYFEKAIQYQKKNKGSNFWLYRSKDNNCQVFQDVLLRANGLMTPKLNEFINQRTVELFSNLPSYLEKLANLSTDLAGSADILLEGNGTIKGGTIQIL